MLPDDRDERPRPDPRAGGRGRIEIIDRAAGGIDAIECIARGAVGTLRDRLIELPIRDARERAALIDDAGERIRKRRVLDAVENDGADGHLAGVRRAAGLRRDQAREQIDLRTGRAAGTAGIAGIASARGQSHGRQRLSPALPSTVRPFFCWKARTARSVPLP